MDAYISIPVPFAQAVSLRTMQITAYQQFLERNLKWKIEQIRKSA
jgi:hypothetical protein